MTEANHPSRFSIFKLACVCLVLVLIGVVSWYIVVTRDKANAAADATLKNRALYLRYTTLVDMSYQIRRSLKTGQSPHNQDDIAGLLQQTFGTYDPHIPNPFVGKRTTGTFGRVQFLPKGSLREEVPLIWCLDEFPNDISGPAESVAHKTIVVFWNGDLRFMPLTELRALLDDLKTKFSGKIEIRDSW